MQQKAVMLNIVLQQYNNSDLLHSPDFSIDYHLKYCILRQDSKTRLQEDFINPTS